jgi:hypothetical protein
MFKDNKTPDNATIESGGALVALLYMIERKEELRKEGVINVFLQSKPIWESHIVQSAETDFKGKATFENLRPGYQDSL